MDMLFSRISVNAGIQHERLLNMDESTSDKSYSTSNEK